MLIQGQLITMLVLGTFNESDFTPQSFFWVDEAQNNMVDGAGNNLIFKV